MAAAGNTPTPLEQARERGRRFERAVAAMDRVMRVWLTHADPRTQLLPDRVPGPGSGLAPGAAAPYTPHNSGADLYPYLILTAALTDPDLYRGRMLEMLRNEVRYTNAAASVPGNLDLASGKLGPFSMFGAGEYAKDGLLSVTEYLGRTPWYARMVDMMADALERSPVDSRFGRLPASDSELNGDYLQVLARLGPMTGDPRFIDWARRIADAYIEEVLPGNHGVPSVEWDFAKHTGVPRMRLRDHGNEMVVGLVLQYANERRWKSAARGEMAARDCAHARSHPRIGKRRRVAVQRDRCRHVEAGAVRPRGQLGLCLRRRVHVLSVHGRDEISRRGPARAAQPAEISAPRVGAAARTRSFHSDRSMVMPTRSKARCISSRANRCRKRSTGSNPRCR